MRLHHTIHLAAATACALIGAAALAPAQAQTQAQDAYPQIGYPDSGHSAAPDGAGVPQPSWRADRQHQPAMIDASGREAWLAECRRRLSARDRGFGGAALGGVVGGLAGNRIAGRGNRTVGTVAGAAVGAAAGYAIDKGEDRQRIRDECETYLDDYYAHHSAVYAAHGQGGYYGQGCCQPMMMVPVMVQPGGKRRCTETITYEYVDAPARAAPRRAVRPAPDRRVPDKRIPAK